MNKIAIIGIGGRTGAMFAHELQRGNIVVGIGREQEAEEVRQGNLFLKLNWETVEPLEVETIKDSEFESAQEVDAIFLCTRNPVDTVIKYYYSILKQKGRKLPILFIPQNGISAGEDAIKALREIFGEEVDKIKVVRVSLLNSVDRDVVGKQVYLSYVLPIRLIFGPISGSFNPGEIVSIFKKAGIEAMEVTAENVKNMEYSKLFLNLIGMASASRGLSIQQGFHNPEVFREEVEMLKEYIKIVEANGGRFINFTRRPSALLAFLIKVLPFGVLLIFKSFLAKITEKGRKGKPKVLDEIEYYNGAIIGLGEKVGIEALINKKIVKRVLNK